MPRWRTRRPHAADDSFALGGVLGYGDNTRIYGLKAVWAPQKWNEMLAPHDLGMRLTAPIARWVASISDTPYHSLIDTSVMAELRYWGPVGTPVRPFIEGGFGFHLLSNVHFSQDNLSSAFTFGEQIAVGATFGDRGRYEVAALIHHGSNARIKQPNDGLTYGGIRLRVALQ